MRKIIFTTGLLFCFTILCLSATIFADLNGKWEGKITTPNGDVLDVEYTFKVDGEKVTGTVNSQMGELNVENGKLKNDDFTFSVNVNGSDFPHKGKVYEDSCGIDIDFGVSTAHFTLKRVK